MTNQAFHIELDLPVYAPDNHESFVIIDALEEYANSRRADAETSDNADFHLGLADAADDLRRRIDAQKISANIHETA